MNCPKCNLVVGEDSLFCEHCGASLCDALEQNQPENAENIEQTMVIPIVKTDMAAVSENTNTDFVKPPVSKPADAPKKEAPKENNVKTKVMLMVLSFVITLVIGLAICAVVMFAGGRAKPEKVAITQTKPQTKQSEKEEKEERGDFCAPTQRRGIWGAGGEK